MGRYEEALSSYREYAEHFPEDPDPFYKLGLLFQRTGKLDSAATYFEKAHLLKPENVEYLVHLGRLRTYRGKFEAALESYEKARSAAVTPSQRVQGLGAQLTHYRLRGQIRKALEIRERVLSTVASASGPAAVIFIRTLTAQLYAEIGQGEKALRKIPIYPEALREKALIHRERGEQAEAVKALEEALRVYEPADSSYVKASRIRSLLDGLTGS